MTGESIMRSRGR